MKWWIKALIATVVWFGICIGGAYLIFPADTTPAQDEQLSKLLGEIFGIVLVPLWLFFAWKAGLLDKNKNQ